LKEETKQLETGARDISYFQKSGYLHRTFKGKSIEAIKVTTEGICVTFSDNLVFRVDGAEIVFGADDKGCEGPATTIMCEKTLDGEPCSFEFLKSLVVGQSVTKTEKYQKIVDELVKRRYLGK
jgi:hypothetical protein